MSPSTDAPFTLPLLQAINDWQSGGDEKQVRRRGIKLKKISAHLPDRYRQCSTVCYRQVALTKSSVWQITAEEQLAEKISAWTTSLSIAQGFKGGVPPDGQGYQGVIFSRLPEHAEVIVNLETLYGDHQFLATAEKLRPQIQRYADGIAKYSGTQCEVVIEMTKLTSLDLYSFGGHSSQFERLVLEAAKRVFGPKPTAAQLEAFRLKVESARNEAGPRWLTPEATKRVLNRMGPTVDVLKMVRKIRDAVGTQVS